MQIWSNFLSRLSPPLSSPPLTSPPLSPPSYSPTKHTPIAQCRITEEEIQQLALWTLNGRDIKNALKMTVSWCHQKGSKVTFLAIEDVIGATCPRARKEEMIGVDRVVESTLSHRYEIRELLDL
ncbi:hypothetical protein BGZ57DRAFT_912612 [Hyaloscypha finlandica]|nr:hypothetical protein BGZ57DRAFT_912612 [Hyaloscypha finlandica]